MNEFKFTGTNRPVFFDFESLATDSDAVVVSLGLVVADFNDRESMTFESLYDSAIEIKFDIESQKESRYIDQSTVEWWKKQSRDAQKILLPSEHDVKLEEMFDLLDFYFSGFENFNKDKENWISRRFFDAGVIKHICSRTLGGNEYMPYWNWRDVVSLIQGLAYLPRGSFDVPVEMLPENVILHDARTDVVLDCLRIKYILDQLEN